jgi:hypothetical protein
MYEDLRLIPIKVLLSWCLAKGIGVYKILVSLTKLVLSSGDWCLQRYERDWCLFLSWCLVVRIGVSGRLLSTKIYKSRLVPTRICII